MEARTGSLHLPALLIATLLAALAIATWPASAAPAGDAPRAATAKKAVKRHGAHRVARRRANRRQGIGNRVALTGPASDSSSRGRGRGGRGRVENPGILFRGDFEAGFEEWHLQALSYRATPFSTGAFQGNAARFEVAEGDVEPQTGSERSEVSGPIFDEGQDLYIRDAIRIPGGSSFDGPWQIVQQLHEEDWDGSPGMAVFLDADDSLTLGSGDSSTTFWESDELQRDRWYNLVYRVYLSRGAGFVEVWLDGAQQRLENGGTRIYGQTIQTTRAYIKAGIYRSRSSSGTSVVEHDEILVGTSFAAVAAG